MVWIDSVANTTIEKAGSTEVEMFTTGHDKQNIKVGLCASNAGNKSCYILFSEENVTLQKTSN